MTALLNSVLLQDLERRLGAQQVPVVDGLQPGLSPDEIQAVVAPRGLRLPLEAERWFNWHNGAAGSLPVEARELSPVHAILSLEEALTSYDWHRELADQLVADLKDGTRAVDWWDPQWIPLTTNSLGLGPAAVDCSVRYEEPTPVRRVDWHVDFETFHKPGAPSLGALVARWIEALDTGLWRYDRTAGRWDVRRESRVAEHKRAALV